MARKLFQCPCCGQVGATDSYIEWFDLPLEDEDYSGEPETEYFDDEMYDSPESYPSTKVPRVDVTKEDGTQLKIQKGISNHSAGHGGITVETVMSGPPPAPPRRPQRARGGIQPLTATNPMRPKKRQLNEGDVARPGFEVQGDDPSGDYYDGLTGQELHQEQLLQAAYEADLRGHGFTPNY